MNSPGSVLTLIIDNARVHSQLVAVELDEQSWTYNELLSNVAFLSEHLNIKEGDIVFQYVERSLEMVCGLLSILFAGGIYCPLNPANPEPYIRSLLDIIPGQIVLSHEKTRARFPNSNQRPLKTFDHQQIFEKQTGYVSEKKDLHIKSVNPCLITVTSGTTGRPKVIIHTHQSLLGSIKTALNCDIEGSGKFLQVAAASWGVHLIEILLPLTHTEPGTIVLLQKDDPLNMNRFCSTIERKQITFLFIGSSMLRALLDYLDANTQKANQVLSTLRHFWTAGEVYKAKDLMKFQLFAPAAQIFLAFGMSETFVCIGNPLPRHIDESNHSKALPIGHPLHGYRCLIFSQIDEEFISPSTPHKNGELYIAGPGLFHSYFRDDELNRRVRVTIDDETFFKTGDLVHYNEQGELIYVGRVDFQFKIRGHRVEPHEIESVLLRIVKNCVVIKVTHHGEDHLIAYVQSTQKSSELRKYCSAHLPHYMVPHLFIFVEQFPMNHNGKLDRKALPPVDFDTLLNVKDENQEPQTEMETKVHGIWCDVLSHVVSPSIFKTLFELGGNSITLMKLPQLYEKAFKRRVDIAELFRQPTIMQHAVLLEQGAPVEADASIWMPLNLTESRASYVQENIWVAERIRFIRQSPPIAVYNTPVAYKLECGSLQIPHFLKSIDSIIARYPIFRTRFFFDIERGYLKQQIIPFEKASYRFYSTVFSTVRDEKEFANLFYDEYLRPIEYNNFRCHLVRCGHTCESTLRAGDFVVFYFHQAVFDGFAVDTFFDELKLAYADDLPVQAQPVLQYIDYSYYERNKMDMDEAKQYWYKVLSNYGWDRYVDLPYDFGVPSCARRSGLCYSFDYEMPTELCEAILARVQKYDTTLLQLLLTCFHIYLFQLSSDNRDICICVLLRNRYRAELENMIGVFSNALPCRFIFDASLDSSLTFIDFLNRAQEHLFNTMKYSYLPYSELLELHRVPSKNLQAPFLQILFELQTDTDYHRVEHGVNFSTPNGESCSLSVYHDMWYNDQDESKPLFGNMFDTDIFFLCDTSNKKLSLNWNSSLDLFHKQTVETLAKGYIDLLAKLFMVVPSEYLECEPLVKLVPIAASTISSNNKAPEQGESEARCEALTPLEEHIRSIFQAVLGINVVDVDKSFFEQGGTSLRALQAIYLLQQSTTASNMTIDIFFKTLSVSRLARAIEEQQPK